MTHYKYLIIGGGMTADAAVRGIRKVDEKGAVGLISMESDPPYSRPMLSKGLWKGKDFVKVWRGTDKLGVELNLSRQVMTLDPRNKLVRDDKGDEYTFDKLLLATGGTPVRLPFGDEEIIYFRTLQDYQRLRAQTEKGRRFVVIGGGFIGSEIAAALAMNGKQVVEIFLEEAIGGLVFPEDLAKFINDYYRQKGVEVVGNDSVVEIGKQGEAFTVRTRGGLTFEADGIVAGIGLRPNIELAKAAGLEIANGIVVDDHLRTSHSDIFAAGDVAEFYTSALGKHIRVEHEDNALKMGELAGRIMAGDDARYDYLPFFYSDLFDLGYEAVGEMNAEMVTYADWEEPFHKGVIYYLSEGRMCGILLWNVWKKVEAAREVIAQTGALDPERLTGRLRG
jgi:3-phenylpropionate/trans-cinnamate dioxygenase ferredoxin reductase subunit